MTPTDDAFDRDLHDALQPADRLDPTRRRALVEAVAPVAGRRRLRFWLGAGAAAAAALVVAAVLLRPRPPARVRPTQIVADLLGPLAVSVEPAEAQPGRDPEAATPDDLASLVWNDLAGPLSIGRTILNATAAEPGRPHPEGD